MNRQSVESSNILEVGYDEKFSTLEIMFSDGKVYQYFDVPENIFHSMVSAESVGKFFHSNVRGVFRFARV